jgi:hypothetical protein
MKRLVLFAAGLILATALAAWPAPTDKTYYVQQPKFSSYSAARQIDINARLTKTRFNSYSANRQADINTRLTAARFTAYTSSIQSKITGLSQFDNMPTAFDIHMIAGAHYELALLHTNAAGSPVDITGSTFYAQYRPSAGGAIFATYSTPIVNAAAGQSKVTLSADQTTALSGTSGFWDLLHIDASGKRKYRAAGTVTVAPPITP